MLQDACRGPSHHVLADALHRQRFVVVVLHGCVGRPHRLPLEVYTGLMRFMWLVVMVGGERAQTDTHTRLGVHCISGGCAGDTHATVSHKRTHKSLGIHKRVHYTRTHTANARARTLLYAN